MLRLEKATLGQFGAQDMMDLITSGGWKSILPDALEDKKLLLISEQLRDLLSEIFFQGSAGMKITTPPVQPCLLLCCSYLKREPKAQKVVWLSAWRPCRRHCTYSVPQLTER